MEKYFTFAAGFFCYASILSLYQDWIGQKAYLYKIQHEWVSADITVPMAIILLYITLDYLFNRL
jgi:hypothetical protein